MNLTKVARKFAKIYHTKENIFWKMLELKKSGLSYSNIYLILKGKGIRISKWATWYWFAKASQEIKRRPPF